MSGVENLPMQRTIAGGVFEWRGVTQPIAPWSLCIQEGDRSFRVHDPYAFLPAASEHDLYLFSQGSNYQAYRLLGAQPETRQDVAGVCFRVWAPNAERASVVGDFTAGMDAPPHGQSRCKWRVGSIYPRSTQRYLV